MKLQQETFHNKGCEINYWHCTSDSANYIIFLHGAGCDHRMFEPQLPIFDEGYHLILWDARGHGLSKLAPDTEFRFEDMVEDFFRLCEREQISNAILVGQSMGGNLAQEILYRRKDMVSKLVLIDCTRNTGRLTIGEKLMLKLTKPIFLLYPWKTLIAQSAAACSNREAVREYVRECFAGMEKSGFIDIMMSLTASLHEDEEYQFPKPVLLLCGVDDKSGNIKKVAAPWAKSDPNCTLKMIADAGHNSNQDNPEEVNQAIYEFIYDQE